MSLPRPPAGIARVTVSGHMDASEWNNIFWLLTTGYDLATGTDVSDLATDMHGAYLTRFLGHTSSDNHLTSTQIVLYQTAGELMGSSSSDHVGGAGGLVAPGGLAAVVSWGTTAFWRGGKPRTYLGGLSATVIQTATTLTSSFVSALNTDAAGFITDVNGMATTNLDTVTLGFLSRVSGGAPRTPGVFFPYFTSFVRTNPGSMRRRNEYTGI